MYFFLLVLLAGAVLVRLSLGRLRPYGPSFCFLYFSYIPFVVGAMIWLVVFEQQHRFVAFDYYAASILYLLFFVGMILGGLKYLPFWRLFRFVDVSTTPRNVVDLCIIFLALVLLFSLLMLFIVPYNPLVDPLGFRIYSSHNHGSLRIIPQILSPVLFGLGLLLRSDSQVFTRGHSKLGAFCVLVSLAWCFVSGSRAQILALFIIFLFMRNKGHERASFKSLLVQSSIFLFAFFAVFLYSVYRGAGVEANRIQYLAEMFFRFDAIYNSLRFFEGVRNDVIDFKIFHDIYLLVGNIIPRFLWEDKPLNLARQIHFALSPELPRDKSSSYFLIEAYVFFGLLGPLLYGYLNVSALKSLDRMMALDARKLPSLLAFSLYCCVSPFFLLFLDGISGFWAQYLLALVMIFLTLKIIALRHKYRNYAIRV